LQVSEKLLILTYQINSNMITNIDITISNADEARNFLIELANNDEAYHPDDDAHEIFNIDSGEASFTEKEADKLNDLMGQIFEIPDFDPYEDIIRIYNAKAGIIEEE